MEDERLLELMTKMQEEMQAGFKKIEERLEMLENLDRFEGLEDKLGETQDLIAKMDRSDGQKLESLQGVYIQSMLKKKGRK